LTPRKRKSALREINDIILAECFALPSREFRLLRQDQDLAGFDANLDGMPLYDQMWLAQ